MVPTCRKTVEISQLQHTVIDVPVVQVVQVHFPVVTQRPFPWSSLSGRPLRFAVAVRTGWSMSMLCRLSCFPGAVVQETVEISQLRCGGVGLMGIFLGPGGSCPQGYGPLHYELQGSRMDRHARFFNHPYHHHHHHHTRLDQVAQFLLVNCF